MDPSRLTQIAQTIHNQLPDIWSIYVYGSQASNKALPESDLDVAVLGPEKISCLKLSETAQSTGIPFRHRLISLISSLCQQICKLKSFSKAKEPSSRSSIR
jgi:hypothetical protein